jgi:hypothetical protein
MIASAVSSFGAGRLSTAQQLDLANAYSAVTAMVSVVEDFAVGSLRIRLEEALSDGSAIAESARAALTREVERSWDDRVRALHRWFEGSLADFSPLAAVRAFVEVRNAVAHGLGSLTSRQIGADGGKKLRQQLASVGVTESGGQLVVPEVSVVLCAISIKATVIAWDDVARRAPARQSTA